MSKTNNINRRKFLEIFAGCICSLMIVACSTAPITERRQLRLLPASTLNRQAAQIYENVKMKTKLNNYVILFLILNFIRMYTILVN